MIINKKIKRTIMENKSQYIGSIMLIIISCMLYTMLNQLSTNMAGMTSSFEKNYVQEDASFVTNNKLNDINNLESKFNASIEECNTFDYQISKDKILRIFSENTKVNIPAIIEGKKLSGNDILIDPAFARTNKLKVGNEIHIFNKSFKIAGFMSLPNYIYPLKSQSDIMSNPDSFGIAVISKDDFHKFNEGNNFYSIKFNSNSTSIYNQSLQFRNYLKGKDIIITQWTDAGENNRITFVNTKIQGISKISSSVPLIILFLTCILTGIVMWRLLKRESVIIGTLYSLGYRRKEIKKHYLLYPLWIGLTGSILGSILGAVLVKPMVGIMVSYFNIPIDSMSFNFKYIGISLLLPILFQCISGYFILNRQLQYSPVELMKGGRKNNKIGFIERKLTLDKLKFSTKFKIREQVRSLPRLIFLLFGVILATMLLLFGFTAKSSLDYLMKDSLKNTFKFQYEYVYNSLRQDQVPSSAETFSAAMFILKSNRNTTFEVCGINSYSKYISLKDNTGAELNKDKVIITKPLAAKLKVMPGDTIRVVNKIDSREYEITAANIAETYAGEYIFMPISQFNSMLGLPAGSYIGLWSKVKLNIPEKLLYSSRMFDDSIKAFNATMQPLQVTIGVIASMSFIIGLIVIYVVTSLIIEENKMNISLMKILGYRRKEINSLILNSSSIIIIVGYIIGIPLILASMDLLFRSLTESIKLAIPITINYSYVIVGFVVVYLTYELSKALNRKKIYKISMSEALKASME
ncbi:ABC transporter permease [Clostridium sp. WILCCON 0269]|uniref:ABC transporter permease n=1 Tax=Candidatus Clostridium eludens TaxID=3381663 RepID=A0ABW8SE39_9CLOT